MEKGNDTCMEFERFNESNKPNEFRIRFMKRFFLEKISPEKINEQIK